VSALPTATTSPIGYRQDVALPSWASNHCKRCKSEPQIAADVIFKIISRGLTTTRSAFVNEHIFFFLTPTQAFIIQASRPFGFLRDCKDLVQESCRCTKSEERLREITGCARFWCDPSGNSLKVIARPVKTSDASFDQRGRKDPQPIAQGANEGTNWKTNVIVLSKRQGRETADPDYLKRFSTRHRSGTMNDSS
jgi:hypothetical protein